MLGACGTASSAAQTGAAASTSPVDAEAVTACESFKSEERDFKAALATAGANAEPIAQAYSDFASKVKTDGSRTEGTSLGIQFGALAAALQQFAHDERARKGSGGSSITGTKNAVDEACTKVHSNRGS